MATDLRVRITGDSTGFNQTLTRAKVNAQAFANRMRTITSGVAGRFGALFSGVAVGMAVRKTIEWADTLADTSRRLDVNVEKLQAWEYAAAQTGSSLSALTQTIEKLKKSQADAGRGLSTSVLGMQALGLGQTDEVETMINKLVALAQSGRIGGLIGPLKDVAGRGSTELIPALKQWQELLDAAERTGVIMKEEQVQVLEKVKDQFTFMGRFMMVTLAPAIQWVSEKLIMFAATVRGLGAAAGTVAGAPASGKRWGKLAWMALTGRGKDAAWEALFGNAKDTLSGKQTNDPAAAMMAEIEKAKAAIEKMRTGPTTGTPGDPDAGDPTSRAGRWRAAQADSLAKVGLFTASGLNAQSIVQRELMYLRKISDNTDPKKQTDRFA